MSLHCLYADTQIKRAIRYVLEDFVDRRAVMEYSDIEAIIIRIMDLMEFNSAHIAAKQANYGMDQAHGLVSR